MVAPTNDRDPASSPRDPTSPPSALPADPDSSAPEGSDHGFRERSSDADGPPSGFRLPDSNAMRFAGAGFELAGSALVGAAVGYGIDRYFENTTQVATAIGAVIGFSGGLYRFIRMALAASDPDRHR